ncbi:hypothetical protein BDV97DRAFT_366687 [Delphinella strobiligena]|nr:hypothetical protein BDV97DRAFT_366687 [Delphinella strobiligena]
MAFLCNNAEDARSIQSVKASTTLHKRHTHAMSAEALAAKRTEPRHVIDFCIQPFSCLNLESGSLQWCFTTSRSGTAGTAAVSPLKPALKPAQFECMTSCPMPFSECRVTAMRKEASVPSWTKAHVFVPSGKWDLLVMSHRPTSLVATIQSRTIHTGGPWQLGVGIVPQWHIQT